MTMDRVKMLYISLTSPSTVLVSDWSFSLPSQRSGTLFCCLKESLISNSSLILLSILERVKN